MVEFRYPHGVVYIFENSKAQRLKVGMTGIGINSVDDRLRDVNDMWLERKVTCQICGSRLVNIGGLVPQHGKKGGIGCLGGGELPIEKDVALAEFHLENLKNRHSELAGSEKGSATRIVNTLEKRIERYRHHNRPVGRWQFRFAFYTEGVAEVELLSHKILADHLDKLAPFGEVFCCSVLEAKEAVETALSHLGLLHSARIETQLLAEHTLYKGCTEYQDPERKPAKYECVICRSQWEGEELGINSCPKCKTHLYSRFLAYV